MVHMQLWPSEAIKIDTDQIVETGEIRIDKTGVDLGMNKIIEEEILEAMWGTYQNYLKTENSRGKYSETFIGMKDYSRDRGRQ